jgi:pullulanase/glycogen debranching enzyme
MIELTILEATENIEKYQKETKTWKDRKVVRKDIKTGDLVLKRKKNWENPGKLQEPWEGPFIAKEHVRGFSSIKSNWRRIVVFVECR